MKRRARERQERRENRQSISKRLQASFLRSFRGQHGGNIVCMRGVPVATGTLGEANSHFDPTKTDRDRTITLRRLLIGAIGVLRLNCLPITSFKSPESRESCDVDTSYVEANRCSESGKNMKSLPLFQK